MEYPSDHFCRGRTALPVSDTMRDARLYWKCISECFAWLRMAWQPDQAYTTLRLNGIHTCKPYRCTWHRHSQSWSRVEELAGWLLGERQKISNYSATCVRGSPFSMKRKKAAGFRTGQSA